MKTYTFTEEQLVRLVVALNQINVVGMAQAEQLTICKQVLDAPFETATIEEREGKKNESAN